MSRFISRGSAARIIVLLVVAVGALSWAQFVPSSRTTLPPPRAVHRAEAPAAAEAPAGQTVLPGAALAPVATPSPQPVATSKHARHARSKGHHRHRRARAHHRRANGHHRRANAHHRRANAHRHHRAASRHAVTPPRRNPWLSSGGRDIGWPQCPPDVGFRGHNGLGQPMPDQGVEFVIIGLTNGRAFTPNPCLDLHLAWVRSHHVQASAYAFGAYPTRAQVRRFRYLGPYDGRQRMGALANAGRAAAIYNVRTMQLHGFTTPHVWLDLEPSSTDPWSGDRARNRAVVRGWLRGYRDAGYTVGFYSTSRLWHSILGRFQLGLPEWRTAGPVSPGDALSMCGGSSIQGGPAVVAQWWTDHRDFDRMCPSPSPTDTMARYFHQW